MDKLDKLPKDLKGGWKFDGKYLKPEFNKGLILRKMGPVDALKIERVMLSDSEEYDGGIEGLSVRPTTVSKSMRVLWSKRTFFIPGSIETLHEYFEKNGYAVAE